MNFNAAEPLFLCQETLEFFLIDAEMFSKVIQLNPANYFLDPIPTSLFKTIYR